MARRVSFYTLGCKLNHYETEIAAGLFKQEGFETAGLHNPVLTDCSAPGVIFINTCTVTSKAEQKARRVIRAALKIANFVIVSGCYAELDQKSLEKLDAPDKLCVVRPSDRARLTQVIKRLASELPSSSLPAPLSRRSRPFIKIQDGCDNACSFCRVRLARGKSVSIPAKDILAELKAAEDAGFAEAVLTGVNISLWTAGRSGLPGLLRYLLDNTTSIALRLSSLEPDAFSDDFFEVFASPRIRPHIHLSAQSGDEQILQAMGRRGSPQTMLDIVRHLREIRGDPFIACDIITGFPGEGEEAFERTLAFCAEAHFAWIHAFPYSPRPGTPAFTLTQGRVSERDAVRRVGALTALANNENRAYAERWLQKSGPLDAVIVASKRRQLPLSSRSKERAFTVLTENYIKVKIPAGIYRAGVQCRCRITHIDAGGVWGKLV
jgi:threonylcarbamoyladenosine tRNA methylthiotransferase MtaB